MSFSFRNTAIALLIVGLFMGVVLNMSSDIIKSNPNLTYLNTDINGSMELNDSFELYNTLDNITQETDELRDKVNAIASKDDLPDVIGGIISGGISVISSIKFTTDVTDVLVERGLQNSGFGDGLDDFKNVAGAILTLLVTFAVLKLILRSGQDV